MKIISSLLILTIIWSFTIGKETAYEGTSPAHPDVRKFLDIPMKDSIDFIRWKLVLISDRYDLNCQYGLSKAGTNGFVNGKDVRISGRLLKQGNYYSLQQEDKIFYILQINPNLLHLLDNNKALMVGNGGYSYTLNTKSPEKTNQVNLLSRQTPVEFSMAFEGRTPCQELSVLLNLNKSDACDKMKWYIILYIDPVTKKPSYYLKGGRGYRKETMDKDKWEILRGKDGRVIYKLDLAKQKSAIYLLKVDENILLFTDPDGNLLVGNDNFSYTLNKTKER